MLPASGPRWRPIRAHYAYGELSFLGRRVTLLCMAEWWSIEVFDAQVQAALSWKDSYRGQVVEAAITNRAVDWNWIEHKSGVVFEVCFADEEAWDAFRASAAVQAALDAVPDPTYGLLVYRGRGGGAGARQPKRPRPSAGAGALELPEPVEQHVWDLTEAELPGRTVVHQL
jgi:hypothetical protein